MTEERCLKEGIESSRENLVKILGENGFDPSAIKKTKFCNPLSVCILEQNMGSLLKIYKNKQDDFNNFVERGTSLKDNYLEWTWFNFAYEFSEKMDTSIEALYEIFKTGSKQRGFIKPHYFVSDLEVICNSLEDLPGKNKKELRRGILYWWLNLVENSEIFIKDNHGKKMATIIKQEKNVSVGYDSIIKKHIALIKSLSSPEHIADILKYETEIISTQHEKALSYLNSYISEVVDSNLFSAPTPENLFKFLKFKNQLKEECKIDIQFSWMARYVEKCVNALTKSIIDNAAGGVSLSDYKQLLQMSGYIEPDNKKVGKVVEIIYGI